MMGNVGLVPILLVLVERPIGAADEPGHACTTQGFLPPPDVPLGARESCPGATTPSAGTMLTQTTSLPASTWSLRYFFIMVVSSFLAAKPHSGHAGDLQRALGLQASSLSASVRHGWSPL